MSSSPDSIDDIVLYYSQNQEEGRVQRHQLEFALMEKIIQTYLSKNPLRILEIGAGPGRYTRKLAQMGHEVVAVEPVPALVQENLKAAKELKLEDKIKVVQGEAREIEKIVKGPFDVILNMGPMYHLILESDRLEVLRQSHNLLKPEGLQMAVFLSKVGYLSYLLNQQPESILHDPEGFQSVMAHGYQESHPRQGQFRGYFLDLNEMVELHRKANWSVQKVHVLDPVIAGRDESFNGLSDDLKLLWSEILFTMSSDPNYWNTGRTWLALSIKSA